MVVDQIFITKSASETQKLGERLAHRLKGGEIVGLVGELGSGKTTFVQGLAKGLGIKKRIISPTFVFIRIYDMQLHETKRKTTGKLYHVDLYRIEKTEEVAGLGLEEIWSDPKNIVVIEWAEKIERILPQKAIKIYFEYVGENKRKVIIPNF